MRTSTFRRITLATAAFFFMGVSFGLGQDAVGVKWASRAQPVPRVVLVWSSPAGELGVDKFNLYRKLDSPNMPYPQNPVNPQPIAALDCQSLQFPGPQSVEWSVMAAALGDANGPGDPCTISGLDPSSKAFQLLDLAAQRYWRIAVAIGQGFEDLAVVNGASYRYEIRGVDSFGNEISPPLATDIAITVGASAVAEPTGLQTIAGDSAVIIYWDEVQNAAAFNVYRATSAGGPYGLVNEDGKTSLLKNDFDGEPILPDASSVNGFVDWQRWTAAGYPVSHPVGCSGFIPQCLSFTGLCPTNVDVINGVTYHYRVAAVDLLGDELCPSPPVSGTPQDTTPPEPPQQVDVTPVEAQSSVVVSWDPVTHDIADHAEDGIQGYRVYRANKPLGLASHPDYQVVDISGLIPPPPQPQRMIYDDVHSAANPLRCDFGHQTFFYHVVAIDLASNASAPSLSLQGHLKDTTKPAPPQNVTGEGFEDRIEINWDLVEEPACDDGDETIGNYLIYRTYCSFGVFAPCYDGPDGEPVCPPLVFLGSVPHAAAKLAKESNQPMFVDNSIPEGSPLCYGYLVKAQDLAQNMSGDYPDPDLSIESYACARLQDVTPPGAAIVTGLKARNEKVRIDWIGEPIQDVKAYEVYRSTTENGVYAFVGGRMVQPPQDTFSAPLQKPAAPGCGDIGLVINDDMSIGFLEDTDVEEKRIYYYKVLGVDYNHNKTPVSEAVPVSTFTFSQKLPGTPVITGVTAVVSPACGLSIAWGPTFDPAKSRGFVVYRRTGTTGSFRSLGSVLTTNSFLDTRIVRGVTYEYRVAHVDAFGRLSPLSAAQSGKVN